MLREDEADGAEDDDFITQDVLLPIPLGRYRRAHVHDPVRSML